MLFFFGAALLLIGMGLIRMEQKAVGLAAFSAGIAVMAIGFIILRMLFRVEFRKK
jgi:uncharacterized protein YjeT (DUF2065 family)